MFYIAADPFLQKHGIPLTDNNDDGQALVVCDPSYPRAGAVPTETSQVLNVEWLRECIHAGRYLAPGPKKWRWIQQGDLPKLKEKDAPRAPRTAIPDSHNTIVKSRKKLPPPESDDEEPAEELESSEGDGTTPLPKISGRFFKLLGKSVDQVPHLQFSIFVRPEALTKMDMWPEEKKERRRPGGQTRPPFPAELYQATQSDFKPEIGKKIPFTPEEDVALMRWMIRALPMMGPEMGKGLTSFHSPCLWHWAQQRLVTQRHWESMKTRCKTTLEHYICGERDVPEPVFQLLVGDPLFEWKDHRLVRYNRAEAERQNMESAQICVDLRVDLKRQLGPPPDAVPERKRSYKDPNKLQRLSGSVASATSTQTPVILLGAEESDHEADAPPPKRSKHA